MKLQQLRFLATVAQTDLNITAAAAKLHTTQPGVSKQLRQLEDELGFRIFERNGRKLAKITPAGKQVIDSSLRILRETQNIRSMCAEFRDQSAGSLSIGTTHTQARYVLPPVITAFREQYPRVQLHLHQGTSEQIAENAAAGRVDLVIATGSTSLFPKFVLLPCYRWNRQLIVPKGHPLLKRDRVTLEDLAAFPIVTYVFSFAGPSSLHEAFAAKGLDPDIAITARDSDVIKTYVRLGLGVGIVANMAIDAELDADLVKIEAAHLFPVHTTWVGFDRDTLLRQYSYDFLKQFSPHLTRRLVDDARALRTQEEVTELFRSVELPVR